MPLQTGSRASNAAQITAGPLGIDDAMARNLINGAVRDPHLSSTHPFVTAVRHAYERLPVAARATAVTAAFRWAKAYVSSPAFTSVYAAARQQARPADAPPEELSVDAEVKKSLDELRGQIAEMRNALSRIPEKDRPTMLEAIKQNEDMLADPAFISSTRDQIVEGRTSRTGAAGKIVAGWEATYPPAARDFVKRELERFMIASARVDFTVPITVFKSPAGAIVGFAAPVEQPYDSWMEVECMLAGREMVSAARAAVEAWLKEFSA
jgi:hypothetical protein